MSAAANIAVYDGASTPVLHTLIPVSSAKSENGEIVADWREGLTSVPDYAQVRLRTTSKKSKTGVWRVSIQVEVPVMESISGQNSAGYTAAPKVAYTNTVQMVAFFHERSTIAERRLARQILANIGNNYTTSVAAATSGVASELLDSLISAS